MSRRPSYHSSLLAATLCLLGAGLPSVVHGAGESPFLVVGLSYVSGDECVVADPDPAEIFLPPQKPHGVRWEVLNPDQNLSWKIVRKADNPGDGDLPIDDPKIPCKAKPSKSKIRSSPAKRSGSWNYEIQVYDCSSGTAELLCTLDPAIIIKGGS